MSATYEEMLKHVDHDFIVEKHTDGDITLWCNDCNMELDTWERPLVNVWHGRLYGEAGGDIHDGGDK